MHPTMLLLAIFGFDHYHPPNSSHIVMKATKDHQITSNINVSATKYIRQVPIFVFIVGHIIFDHDIVVTWLLGSNVVVKDTIHQIAFHILAMLAA